MNFLLASIEGWAMKAAAGFICVGLVFVVAAVALGLKGWWDHRQDRKEWE